jgi:hypothetical protein
MAIPQVADIMERDPVTVTADDALVDVLAALSAQAPE